MRWVLFLFLALTGCLAHGTAHIVKDPCMGVVTADLTYLRIGDQQLSDFEAIFENDGSGYVRLGSQNSTFRIDEKALFQALGATITRIP